MHERKCTLKCTNAFTLLKNPNLDDSSLILELKLSIPYLLVLGFFLY